MVTQIIPDVTPLPKRTTNNYASRRHHWANLRTQKWGWSTSCTTQTETLHSRMRGTAMRWLQGPFPMWPTLPTAPPVAKECTGVTSSTPSTGGSPLGTPALVSPHGNHRVLWAQPLRIWLRQTKGGGASSQQQWGLRGQNSCLQSTHRKPNQQPALLQPSWLAQSGQGTRVHLGLPNSGLQMKSSPSPAAWSAHIQQRSWVLAPLPILHGNHGSQSLLPESLFRKTGELSKVGSPSSTQAEVGSRPAHRGVWSLPAPIWQEGLTRTPEYLEAAKPSNSWADGQVRGQNGWSLEQSQ